MGVAADRLLAEPPVRVRVAPPRRRVVVTGSVLVSVEEAELEPHPERVRQRSVDGRHLQLAALEGAEQLVIVRRAAVDVAAAVAQNIEKLDEDLARGLDFQSNMFISEPRRLRVSFISSCDASWNVVPSGPGVGVGGSDIVDPVEGLPSAHTTVRQWRAVTWRRRNWFNVGWHWIGRCARLLRPVPERRKERARRAAAVEHALRDELWSVSQG